MVGTCFNKIYSLKHSTHTESPLDFETTKPETVVVTECRNVFCSLDHFKTWLLRWSLCRQPSQQASRNRLRYSLAGEITKAGYEFIE